MAKTGKVKKRPVSIHSRAARRETSPSLNLDKSLKTTKPPAEDTNHHGNVLGTRSAGISKRKKQKPMSRQQRLRLQKGVERAGIVNDRLEKKVQKSVASSRKIKERRANWNDLNGKTKAGKPSAASTNKFENDDVMEEDKVNGKTAETMLATLPVHSKQDEPANPEQVRLPEEDEDEIL